MSVSVLVVEDDKNLVNLLRGYLEREGFEVHEALDGVSAVEAARVVNPEVVVLDWMLPGLDGMGVLSELRRFSGAYVIMLTARSEELDKIVGLSTRADDCLTKPFSPDEPVARVRAMLRRPRRGDPGLPTVPPLLKLTVDPGSREVTLRGEVVSLTALEFDPLSVLASRPRFVFGRSRLLGRVWGEGHFGSDHVVNVHVASLRKRIEDDPAQPRVRPDPVRGVGCRFARG